MPCQNCKTPCRNCKAPCRNCKAPCQVCKAKSSEYYKNLTTPKNSGLIYMRKEKDSVYNTQMQNIEDEAYIFHYTSGHELHRPKYGGEIRKLKTKCFRVRSLLDELIEIRQNQILGVCEHCRRANTNKCPRCDFILSKFLIDKVQQCEERQRRFKVWLCRVRHLLESMLQEDEVCKYKVYQDSGSTSELAKLLQQLKAPLAVHEPNNEFFPIEKDQNSLQNLRESREMIDELIMKLNTDQQEKPVLSDNSVYLAASKMCICKYFMDKEFDGIIPELGFGQNSGKKGEVATKTASVFPLKEKLQASPEKEQGKIRGTKKGKSLSEGGKSEFGGIKYPRSPMGNLKGQQFTSEGKLEELKLSKNYKSSKLKKQPSRVNKISEITKSERMFLNLIGEFKQQLVNKKVRTPKTSKEPARRETRISDLPTINRESRDEKLYLDAQSESFIVCEGNREETLEMIKSDVIVPYDPNNKHAEGSGVVPLLFEVYSPSAECLQFEFQSLTHTPAILSVSRDRPKTVTVESMLTTTGSRFSYSLSNKMFIENGITKLPTAKIMRKIYIYKMNPHGKNWFKEHKSSVKYYRTGEILAEVKDNSNGKWFYKNGDVALEYYDAEEVNTRQRYVIYSSARDPVSGRRRPQTVLASFDFLGNGVVYDHHGNIRLKYNQYEGLIVDKKIGPPGRWKWHTLNDPPVLQQMYIDTNLKKRDPIIEAFQDTQPSRFQREREENMVTIELEHFVKEKAVKLLQKFKLFQIRMKACKLNEQFSLKILDQANITINFRDGTTSERLNIGMFLINNEIVDTDTAEVSEVSTPYDKRPGRTKSIVNIQNIVDRVRKENKLRMAPKW